MSMLWNALDPHLRKANLSYVYGIQAPYWPPQPYLILPRQPLLNGQSQDLGLVYIHK